MAYFPRDERIYRRIKDIILGAYHIDMLPFINSFINLCKRLSHPESVLQMHLL